MVNDSDSTDDDLLDVTILDVGHGNSALVRDGRLCAVIDAEPGTMIATELEESGCDHIEHLIFSHSDNDHAGGGPTLLLDDARTIGTVWFNPDSGKNTVIWHRLLRAVYTRHRRGGLGGHQMIHTEIDHVLRCGRARLEVSHPSILMAGTGPTSSSEFGRLTPNTLSVVIRVHLEDEPAVLLAADMDDKALQHIRAGDVELAAPVLVFPHHGGLPGAGDPETFARTLSELVRPELVIFSIKSASRPANPHRAIMSGVQQGAPAAHIACTQLSVHCHALKPAVSDGHLSARASAGRARGHCCAGTITIKRVDGQLLFDPPLEGHRDFVALHVDAPLCKAAALDA